MGFFLDREAVFIKLKGLMTEVFGLDPESITPDKKLEGDLHLDSLDMVDLILAINDQIPDKKLDPSLFKNAREVDDLTGLILPFFN